MCKAIIDTSFNLFLLSKYRTQLMGVAAMMIILCHAPQYGVEVSGFLRKLLVFFNIGVDIFLFLSGMGCYFSLVKSNSYFLWLKKRFSRIFIPYAIVLFMLRFIGLCVDNVSWNEWLLYFSTIRFWSHHDGMWYVALLVLLYPLAPLLHWTLEKSCKRAITAIALIALLLLITHIPVSKTGDLVNSIIINLQGAFKRVASFILGLYLAPYIKQGIRINTLYLIGLPLLGYILFHYLAKEVFFSWLYVLPILIILCFFFNKFPDKSYSNIFFLWLGAASLESYLTNVGIKALMPLYLNNWFNHRMFVGHYLDYLIIIFLGLLLTFISNNISKKTINNILS